MATDRADSRFDSRADRLYGLYLGIVKDTSDHQYMGRLGVWIPELCAQPDELITVSYGSPFAGASDVSANGTNAQVYDDTQKSYGFWAVPPDINNTVLVMFINGHISRGVWIGGLYQQNMNQMVPNISAAETAQHGSTKVPAAEYNKKVSGNAVAENNIKPYHKPHYDSIRNQGLKRDKVRGFSQHGARSAYTSKVSGMLSPKGHYWSIEDTEDDEKIRIRTRSGVQVLLDDSRGLVYVINKSGSGWVEIDDKGKIMIYGEQGIGVRSKGDINLRADNDLIFESGRNIFMKSGGNTNLENNSFYHKSKDEHIVNVKNTMSEKVGRKHTQSLDDIQISVATDYKLGTNSFHVNSSTLANMTAGSDVNLKAGGELKATSGGNSTLISGGTMATIASGPLMQQGAVILQNAGGGGGPAESAQGASPDITTIPDLDTFNKKNVSQPHSEEEPSITDIKSINTIFPSHEPCPEHDVDPEKRA